MNQAGLFTAYRIQEKRLENAVTCSLVLDGSLPDALPGQFVMAWLPGIDERPFSLSGNDPMRITVADVGPFSHALNQLQPGDHLWLRGPLGKGFTPRGHSHLLLGGGYGAAPLIFLAKSLCARGDQVGVCLGARSCTDFLLVEEFESLGCLAWLATEDGSAGKQGLLTALLPEAQNALKPETLYACGPIGMLLAIAAWARTAGLPAQLSFESVMRCGVGLCGSCELPEETCQQLGLAPGFLVCHDGPVGEVKNDRFE
ncbi:MAG TPA: dihydroorotate dehydrogenase electron transfer subunit [Anaerolineaceae bacterium]|nr:dihydroorotate dehydrogenase electron transfer subunit [Anaerolineaceae bacterium]